jgi:ketosteroid isomerase-like protein
MKKKSFHTLCLIVVSLFLISACTQSKNGKSDNSSSHAVSADSLMNEWNVAWNKHDTTAISNMFANNSVVVFSSKERLMGVDSIMTNWVNRNLPNVANLKTEKVSSSTSSEMVFFNGTYTLDITKNDTVIGADMGCFTFVWKLQNKNDWKMELLFFGKNPE